MNNKTILISGAGIAGPTLAFWLKAAGFEPTLIERAPALRTGGYVIDFWGLGYDIAERMGLARDITRVASMTFCARTSCLACCRALLMTVFMRHSSLESGQIAQPIRSESATLTALLA